MIIKDQGIFLSDFGANMICARKKKEIILDKHNSNFVGKPIFLCGDKIYGIIVLNEPHVLDKNLVKNHESRHLIKEQLRDAFWPGADRFYAYSFRIKRIFKEPIPYDGETALGFVDDVKIAPEVRREFVKGVIGFKDLGKAPIETSWDGPAERKMATVEDLRIMSAWFDSANPDVKSSYKLPHHKAEGQHVAVWNGVRAAMAALLGARGGTAIPTSDRKGVYNHLVRHYKQFDKEPPVFKTYSDTELEKMFPEFFKADEIEDVLDFSKYYEDLEKLEGEFIAKAGYEDLRVLILKLYRLLLNRMELKAHHNDKERRRKKPKSRKREHCTAEDRRMGRCKPGQIYRSEKYDNYDEAGFIKQVKIVVEGNYVRARLREPSTIIDGTFRTITLSEQRGIKAVIGRLKSDPEGPTHVQSVLFKKDKWTVASAREWISEHRDDLKNLVLVTN